MLNVLICDDDKAMVEAMVSIVEFVENASSIFEEHGKAEREAKRKEAAAAKERDKMLKTIGQLTVERNFLQDCFRAVGKPIPELDPEKQR